MLRVSGTCRDPDSVREAYEVLVDVRSELSVILLSLESARPGVSVHGAIAVATEAVLARRPVYDVVSALRAWCADPERDASVAFALLRFAQPDSRIEILNAGMPALACILPGGRVALHPPLSHAIGGRLGEAHPYELSPLVWGSVWVVMSKGLTNGVADTESVYDRLLRHDLSGKGPELAGLAATELSPWLPRLAGRELHDDASVVFVHADPARRFQSGIR